MACACLMSAKRFNEATRVHILNQNCDEIIHIAEHGMTDRQVQMPSPEPDQSPSVRVEWDTARRLSRRTPLQAEHHMRAMAPGGPHPSGGADRRHRAAQVPLPQQQSGL